MTLGSLLEVIIVLLCLPDVQGQYDWWGTYSSDIRCAVRGSTVKMNCRFRYPQTETLQRTLWIIQGQSSEVGLESLPQFRGRVQHQCSDNNCTMIISDVRKQDTGVYTLRIITSKNKNTFLRGVSLKVTELVIERTYTFSKYLQCKRDCNINPYVWYENGVELKETSSYYHGFTIKNSYSCAVKGHEDLPSAPVCPHVNRCNKLSYTGRRSVCAPAGSSVRFSCSYSYTGSLSSQFWFSPQQSQHWTEPSTPEDVGKDPRYSSSDVANMGESVSNLTISDLRGGDSAQFLFKFKTSDVEWRSMLAGVSLTVTDLQVQASRWLSSTRVELRCLSSCKSSDHHSFFWSKNGHQVDVNRDSYEVDLRSGDSFICGLEGHEVTSAPLYNPLDPSVVQSPPGEVVEGRSVNLTCSSDANLHPGGKLKFTWKKTSNVSQQFVGKDLLFSSVRSSDSGEFSCSVESEFRKWTSQTLIMDVQYAPRPPSVSVSADEVKAGASVNLTCSSDANPQANYTWYLEGDPTAVASGQMFTITEVRRDQAGSYVCRAQNLRGQHEAAVLLTVGSDPIKAAAVGSITALLLLLSLLVAFLLLRKLRPCSPASQPREIHQLGAHAAETEEDVEYSVVNVVRTKNESVDPIYSNVMTPPAPEHTREEDVVYAAVKK